MGTIISRGITLPTKMIPFPYHGNIYVRYGIIIIIRTNRYSPRQPKTPKAGVRHNQHHPMIASAPLPIGYSPRPDRGHLHKYSIVSISKVGRMWQSKLLKINRRIPGRRPLKLISFKHCKNHPNNHSHHQPVTLRRPHQPRKKIIW